jgi:hypothetical protein
MTHRRRSTGGTDQAGDGTVSVPFPRMVQAGLIHFPVAGS